jgi:hypothetical protein
MRRRKRIARALDWLIAGWIESPMIDQEMLDALINAVAALEPEGNTWDRATNVRAERPPPTS